MSSQWPVAASIQILQGPGQTRFWLLPALQLPVLCHQLDSSASVLLGEEEDTLGLGPRQCSMTVPAPPGSVILVICRFFHQVRKNYFLSLSRRFCIWEIGP